jgi:hypothetical protein
MDSTAEVLRNEAKRLRSLAERMEAFALELDGGKAKDRTLDLFSDTNSRRFAHSPNSPVLGPVNPKEFKGMTQHAAILKALEAYGPQTVRQLFIRLNSGGMAFKKPVYVTAVLGRLKDVTERTDDNQIKLKEKSSTANTHE